MLLTSSLYGMYINSQDINCLLENQPFLPKTLAVFWKIGLFYQRRYLSFGKSAFFSKDVCCLLENQPFLPKTLLVF